MGDRWGSAPTRVKNGKLWTGLLDKNGEEIYDGDFIVSHKSGGVSNVYQVGWLKDVAQFWCKYKGFFAHDEWNPFNGPGDILPLDVALKNYVKVQRGVLARPSFIMNLFRFER